MWIVWLSLPGNSKVWCLQCCYIKFQGNDDRESETKKPEEKMWIIIKWPYSSNSCVWSNRKIALCDA